jgi:peptidoglycan/xylan/chitin deacetylase (PgdA/CDA1 family)
MNEPARPWPEDADVCVALTFDVDADVGASWRGFDKRLTSASEARYGAVRGLPRILEVLRRRGLRATFYVPGEVAEKHTAAIVQILEDGHVIGHHGHEHFHTDQVGDAEQRAEIERGLEALDRHLGIRPDGYRSPGWELTPTTLALLVEFGFRWDSSCMGDDRPYMERHGDLEILELPVHWSLDDWVYFLFTRDGGGIMSSPRALQEAWLDEFDSALAERRMVTYTMHPEAIGRGYRMQALERVLDEMSARGRVWFATHDEVARIAV